MSPSGLSNLCILIKYVMCSETAMTNTNVSFAVADSNSFFSPLQILPEKQIYRDILRILSYFIMKMYGDPNEYIPHIIIYIWF